MQFAATPEREARMVAGSAAAPYRQESVSARADALEGINRGISHIQHQEDGRHLDHPQTVMACIRRARKSWHGAPSDRLNELRAIYDLSFLRKADSHQKLSGMRGRMSRLAGVRRKAVGNN